MKYFNAILIIALIFILPAGSYLYLRSGFIFRKDTLEELKQEIPLTIDQKELILSQDSTYFNESNRIVNLMMKVQDNQDEKDLYFLAESMKQRKDFTLTAFFVNTELPTLIDTTYSSTINRMTLTPSNTSTFFKENERFILLKNDMIRKIYGNTEDEFNSAYEQMVILLPVKKREKLILIRDNEK